MANVLALGKLPGCYRLRNRAIHCDLEGGHYHLMEGGDLLDHKLDLKRSIPGVPIACKTTLVQNIMPQTLDVEMEAVLLPWNCNTCSSKGPSPVLHPEVDWCKFVAEPGPKF